MKRSVPIAIACAVVLSFTSVAGATDVPAESNDIALSVARLFDSRSMVESAFLQMLPGEAARELARRLLAEHQDLWSELDREVADHLEQTFTQDQLVELHRFLTTETGRIWLESSSALFARLQDSSSGTGSVSFRMASIGCAVALLASNVDTVKERVGDEESGLPDALYESLRPARERATKTCDCILGQALEKWPSSSIMQVQMQPEFQEYTIQLMTDGTCPMPFER